MLSKIYKVDSASLEELERESEERDQQSKTSRPQNRDVEQGFRNSSALEDNLNRTYLRIYSETTQDDFFDEVEQQDKLGFTNLKFL